MSGMIRRELLFPQPPPQVWRSIADREALADWLFPNDFEPRVGHRFTFNVPPNPRLTNGLTVHCEVLECDPPKRLVFTWSAGGAVVDTRVSFQLEPNADGTRLSFEHSGFDVSHFHAEQAFKGAGFGWTKFFNALPAVIARRSAGEFNKDSDRP
jgi:uncharacterized protein YndB with AHSA1/START domain